MIELKQYPTQEDFLDGIARCTSLVQTALGDIQYLAKRFSDGNYYMTEEQVADYMKCTVDEIPKMTKYRAVWSRGYNNSRIWGPEILDISQSSLPQGA